MKTGKRILGTVLLLVAVIGLLIPLSYMLRPNDGTLKETHNRVTGFYGEEEDSLDVVVLGSSAVYRYVNSLTMWEEQGITSYNISTANQSVFTTNYLIDEALTYQSPDLIVLETRQFLDTETEEPNEKWLKMIVNNMKYSWNRIEMINNLIPNWEDRIPYYFDIIYYHSNWELLTKESLEYADNTVDHELKGWRNISVIKSIKAPDVTDVEGELPITEAAEKALHDILEKCKNENIEILFVATPYQTTEERQMQSNYMKSMIEEYGYQYLDFNKLEEDFSIDFSKDFYNKTHVNAIGAEKVSKYLGQYIADHYDVKNDHSEEVTEEWNTALALHQEQMVKIREKYNNFQK